MKSFFPLSAQELASLRRRLRAWFARQARPLPWRRTRDPYAIWVSEIMLQQTQVATVIPYFERFLQAFPKLPALAEAPAQKVLRLWEGLGYYRRARSLHQAAQIIMAEHHGQFPQEAAALLRLPGFGRYTAHAVLSQAFDTPLPILEANSERVLCRLLAIHEDPRRSDIRNLLWDAAGRLLPRRRAGAFNQALMEVGALVCKPVRPDCPACPLRPACRAHAKGLQEQLPRRADGKKTEAVREVALIIGRRGKVLWTQRPDHGRWPALWEFPHVALENGETHEAAARRLLHRLGIQARLGQELGTIRHAVTRFQITLMGLTAQYRAGQFQPGDQQVQGLWLTPPQLQDYPVSVPQRKLARLVAATR